MGRLQNFFRWYFHIDLKDITNYICLALAIFLFWWGIKTIIVNLNMPPPP